MCLIWMSDHFSRRGRKGGVCRGGEGEMKDYRFKFRWHKKENGMSGCRVGGGGRVKNKTKSSDIILLVSYEVGDEGIFLTVVRRHRRSTQTYAWHSCDNVAVVCRYTEYGIGWNVQCTI